MATALSNLTLFVIGVLVTIPTATVICALVFAAGIDERAEKRRRTRAATTPEPQVL